MSNYSLSVGAIEALRVDLVDYINQRFDEMRAKAGPNIDQSTVHVKMPTAEDGRDLRNKIGLNLTPRGAELLYRMFDVGAGYNRAAKLLSITQAAAKNRKKAWEKAGGLNREKLVLDIDG